MPIKDSTPLRLDVLLVERGLAKSRTHAKKLIESGRVTTNIASVRKPLIKPSLTFDSSTVLFVAPHEEDTYVSRAGLKLEAALKHAGINTENAVALDVGQSTGGFTDCLLKQGAAHVVGVEVGHHQLHESLRTNLRVTCLEGINARYMGRELIPPMAPNGFDIAVIDVSFISQTLVLPNIAAVLKPGGCLISLVKPQFEVGKAGIGKGGIVKSAALYDGVQQKIKQTARECGFEILDYIASPIEGGDGNKEFLLIAQL